MIENLIVWLQAQLDEDEQWAKAASAPYRHADAGGTAPTAGVHWQWVAGESWEPVTPDPVVAELVEGPGRSWDVNLATVETWPVTTVIDDGRSYTREARRTYAYAISEMDASAAGHIVRHDPARVLAKVAAIRSIIDHRAAMAVGVEAATVTVLAGAAKVRLGAYDTVLRLLATEYADYPGYRKEWRPA